MHIARCFHSLLYQVSFVDSRQLFHEAIHKLGRAGYYVQASVEWTRAGHPVLTTIYQLYGITDHL